MNKLQQNNCENYQIFIDKITFKFIISNSAANVSRRRWVMGTKSGVANMWTGKQFTFHSLLMHVVYSLQNIIAAVLCSGM